MTTRTAHCNYE